MSFVVISGAAASSGRYVTAAPTVTHTAAGQFTITNYNATTTTYTLSNQATGSRSGAVVSLANVNDSTNITSSPLKLGYVSSPKYVERKAYTASIGYSYFVETGFNHFPGPCPPGSTACPDGTCGQPVGYNQPACCLKDPLPPGPGWEDTYGEWARIL